MREPKKKTLFLLLPLVLVLLFLLARIFLFGPGRQNPPAQSPTASKTQPSSPQKTTFAASPPPPIRNGESRRLLAQVPEKDKDFKPFLQELLALKERDGRDNALIHYAVAGWSMPHLSYTDLNSVETTISITFKVGWTSNSEALRPYLKAWQPGFREMRKGVSLDYASGIGTEKGYQVPMPNFLAVQMGVKAMCVEGCLFENEKRASDALDNYLTSLAMGCDFTSPGNILISHLVAINSEKIALDRINSLVTSDQLSTASLSTLLDRLKKIEKKHGLIIDVVTEEIKREKTMLDSLKKDPKGFLGTPKTTLWDVVVMHDKRTLNEFASDSLSHYRMTHGLDQAEKDLKDISDIQMRFMRTPWWEDNGQYGSELSNRLAKSHFLVRESSGDYITVKTRFIVVQSSLRGAQINTAIALWKKKHGTLPRTLEDLRPDYFPAGLPIDPFSGKDYLYSPNPKTNQYTLSSAGPDKKTDATNPLTYDPTNGTVSPGDIPITR